MAKSRRNQYRSSLLPTLMIGGTAVGLFGLATVAVLWSMGMIGGSDSVAQKPIDRTGMLAFPALAKPVAAFEKLTSDHYTDPRTRQLHVMWLPESQKDAASRNMSELLGRVLSRDKKPNSVLSERDLLPVGTKPGVAAGIPPGKFAVTIPTADIPGLDQLRHGDRFDLMVSLGEGLEENDDKPRAGNTEPAAVFGGVKPPSLRVGQLSRQHGVKRLVTSGQLIALTKGTVKSTSGGKSLTIKPNSGSGSKPKTNQKTFAEIAISDEEIGPLTQAISLDTPMTCVVRSGRPESVDEEAFSTEGLVPVITTAVNVEAYSALSDQSLIDDATGRLHYYYFPPDRVPQHWLTDPTEVYGRVVSRSLRRGSPITQSDLLPAGTKPGISAGVPAGMSAMVVAVDQLAGFGDLVQGDRFAIHAQIPENVAKPVSSSWVQLQGGSLSPEAQRIANMLGTGIREVVPTAIYLRHSDDETATIAIPDDRIAEFAQLIRDAADLFVVAKGANDDTPANPVSVDDNLSAFNNVSDNVNAVDDTENFHAAMFVATQLIAAQDTPEQSTAANQIQVPILTRGVGAFKRLTVDDFIDPATGQIRYVNFPADRVRSDWQTDAAQLIDRVTIRDLQQGRAVSAQDLAPPGSPEGPSAGIPAGMEGLLVDSAEIEDLDLVGVGAKFDIVLGQSIRPGALGDQVRRTLTSPDAVVEANKLPSLGVQVSRTLATGAVLLSNFGSAERTQQSVVTQRSTTTRTTPTGGIVEVQNDEQPSVETTSRTVTRFAIAVPKSQAPRLSAALNRNMPLRVVLARLNTATGTGLSPTTSGNLRNPSIRTFVREHVVGDAAPVTEVFVSDLSYPESQSENLLVPGDAVPSNQGGSNE